LGLKTQKNEVHAYVKYMAKGDETQNFAAPTHWAPEARNH